MAIGHRNKSLVCLFVTFLESRYDDEQQLFIGRAEGKDLRTQVGGESWDLSFREWGTGMVVSKFSRLGFN